MPWLRTQQSQATIVGKKDLEEAREVKAEDDL